MEISTIQTKKPPASASDFSSGFFLRFPRLIQLHQKPINIYGVDALLDGGVAKPDHGIDSDAHFLRVHPNVSLVLHGRFASFWLHHIGFREQPQGCDLSFLIQSLARHFSAFCTGPIAESIEQREYAMRFCVGWYETLSSKKLHKKDLRDQIGRAFLECSQMASFYPAVDRALGVAGESADILCCQDIGFMF